MTMGWIQQGRHLVWSQLLGGGMKQVAHNIAIIELAPAIWSVRVPYFASDADLLSLTERLRARLTERRSEKRPLCLLVIVDDDELECQALPQEAFEFWKQDAALLAAVLRGVGIVTSETRAKGVVAAFAWRTNVSIPMSVHASLEHALHWARQTLAKGA